MRDKEELRRVRVLLPTDNHEVGCLADTLAKGAQWSLNEAAVAQILEKCFSDLIAKSMISLSPKDGRGSVFLSRSNARELGPDAFFVNFCPTSRDHRQMRGTKYSQVALAGGHIFERRVVFYHNEDLPAYVEVEFVPELKRIFSMAGFKLLEEIDVFGKVEPCSTAAVPSN